MRVEIGRTLGVVARASFLGTIVIAVIVWGSFQWIRQIDDSQLLASVSLASPDGSFVAEFYEAGAGGAAGSTVLRFDVRPTQAQRHLDFYTLELFLTDYLCLTWHGSKHISVGYPVGALLDGPRPYPGSDVLVEVERTDRPGDCRGFLAQLAPRSSAEGSKFEARGTGD